MSSQPYLVMALGYFDLQTGDTTTIIYPPPVHGQAATAREASEDPDH